MGTSGGERGRLHIPRSSSPFQGMSAFPSTPTLDDTYGALLIGTFLGLMLYGASLHQLVRYVRLFRSDVPSIRLLVTSVMVLETIHVVFTMHVCYYYLVRSYLKPQVLLEAIWTLQLFPALMALTACVSKAFLARRAFLTGPRSKWAVIVVVVLLVAELALAILLSAKGFILKNLMEFAKSTVSILTACEATSAAADALLAGTIIATLWNQDYHKRQPSMSWAKLMTTYMIKSGLPTAILNLIALVLAQTHRKAFIYAAINIVTMRVYANMLFAVLNSRKLMANGRMEVFANSESVSLNAIAQANRVAQAEMWNAPYRPQTSPATIKVNVTAEREQDGLDHTGSMRTYDKKSMSLEV
ncbi:hypothetical protein BC628DRAFT_251584 [Trametes gibbosa]|nr:hypothetical protein BC628DRAFT_251584 [Trametes gibbosa]